MTREQLVKSKYTLFRSQSQRDDLLDPTKTKDSLIALLSALVLEKHYVLFLAIKSDHHDDSSLGEHSHFNGYCADVWFNKSSGLDDYLPADSHEFCQALVDARKSLVINNIGLAGEAWIPRCRIAAGITVFHDEGADHVHLSAQ